jgi:hypothetical protein
MADTGSIAQVVFRHDPTSSPQWSYYGINAPLTGSAQKLSEAKFSAKQDLQFLSGEEDPGMRSYAEWAVDQEPAQNPAASPEAFLHAPAPIFVRTLQDEDTNLRLQRQNLAQAYLESVRELPELRTSLPALLGGGEDGAAPSEVILVTLFPQDLLGDALLNLSALDTVVFCLPEDGSLGFLPVSGADVWPDDGTPGLLDRLGLDEFASVRDLMEASDGEGDTAE